MFKRILIANRGEIALRILRCCSEMNIETVVVYSEADEDSLPVMLATHSVCIGSARAAESYLNEDVIVETAVKLGCDAIHPGYGFLSENAGFGRKCRERGIIFIGPAAEIIAKMGDKQAARELMQKSGVPVVPGSKGLVNSLEEAVAAAQEVGYPVLIKAAFGGGGKGMRRAYDKDELAHAFEAARAEAKAAFGEDGVYVERLIEQPRHIEVQILADRYGNVTYLGERDCSIQRRNQKLLEEAPSRALSGELRERMGETAVRAARAAGYESAGTVEFVLDQEKNFYFIEMNTRIQVEHPVTEWVTGINLIREQIRIAAGLKLSRRQEEIMVKGHAIECRINAESTGKITFLHFPAGCGVRVDSHLYAGYEVTPYYDSMLAKIIVRGDTRLEAIRRLRGALEELVIEGVPTNAEFMHLLTYHKDFVSGRYDTSFWDKNSETILAWKESEGAQ